MEDQVILNNDQDRRTFAWLRMQVGDEAITNAISGLSGARKPYVSNLCKVLAIIPPVDLEKTDRDIALQNLAKIRSILTLPTKIF